MTSQLRANRLTAIAGVLGATLGLLMVLGGFGIGLAVLSSPQPRLQVMTALLLSVVGFVNLRCSRRVWNASEQAFLWTGVATMALVAYLGVGLRDFGEPFWAHGVYLLLLLVVWFRTAKRTGIAA
jgi:uncharacterized membrane protein